MHAVMFRVVQEEPDLAGVTDPALHGLISGCLAKLPAERPAPEQIAELTGPPEPEGAWLPAPLIADLGRQAVRLLDTDSPPAGGAAGGPASRPGGYGMEGGSGTPAGAGAAAGAETPYGIGTPGGTGTPTGADAAGPWPRAAGAGPAAAGHPAGAAPEAEADADRQTTHAGRPPATDQGAGAGGHAARAAGGDSEAAAAQGARPPATDRDPGAEPRHPGAGATDGAGDHTTPAAAGAWRHAAGGSRSEAVTDRHTRHTPQPPAADRGSGSGGELPGHTRAYETRAISHTATDEPPRRRPRRTRLLTTLALLIAAGVAVPVALAATQRDDGDTDSGTGTAAGSSDVPARYVGSWFGTQLRDGRPTGIYRQFTIRRGQKGDIVATSIALTGKSQCTSEARLGDVGNGLHLTTKVVEAAPAGECTAVGGHTLTYANGALRWRAADGRTGELTRVEPRDLRVPRELLGRWQRPAGSGTQVMRVEQAAPGDAAVVFTTRTGDGDTCRARADFVGVDARDDRVLLGPSEITSVSGPEESQELQESQDAGAADTGDDLGDDSGSGRLGGPCVPGFPSAMQATADGSVLDRQFLGGEQRTRHYTRADGSPADPTQ
jgi:hypothetical protein